MKEYFTTLYHIEIVNHRVTETIQMIRCGHDVQYPNRIIVRLRAKRAELYAKLAEVTSHV